MMETTMTMTMMTTMPKTMMKMTTIMTMTMTTMTTTMMTTTSTMMMVAVTTAIFTISMRILFLFKKVQMLNVIDNTYFGNLISFQLLLHRLFNCLHSNRRQHTTKKPSIALVFPCQHIYRLEFIKEISS